MYGMVKKRGAVQTSTRSYVVEKKGCRDSEEISQWPGVERWWDE